MPPQPQLPMFERGQPSAATLYNAIAQTTLTSIGAIQTERIALESQLSNLESRMAAASPQFASLLADANNLNSQIAGSITANNSSNTGLDNIQSNLTTNDQNAQIQLDRIPGITSLINSLTIGEEIQGFSDLLNRIAGATRLADRILGTDASGNVTWRQQGSVGSGVLLRAALLVRRLTDTAGGGNPAVVSWQPIPLIVGFNNISGLSVSGNQIICPAGEYAFMGFSVGCSSGFQARLRNITAGNNTALATYAKATTSGAIATEPINFISRLRGANLLNSTSNLELQGWYESAAPVATNTQGASANISGYAPQQSALLILRIIY